MLTVIQAALSVKDTPVKVNAAHPGSVVTDMNAQGSLTVKKARKPPSALPRCPTTARLAAFSTLTKRCPGRRIAPQRHRDAEGREKPGKIYGYEMEYFSSISSVTSVSLCSCGAKGAFK